MLFFAPFGSRKKTPRLLEWCDASHSLHSRALANVSTLSSLAPFPLAVDDARGGFTPSRVVRGFDFRATATPGGEPTPKEPPRERRDVHAVAAPPPRRPARPGDPSESSGSEPARRCTLRRRP